jgi:hypothetical protein
LAKHDLFVGNSTYDAPSSEYTTLRKVGPKR